MESEKRNVVFLYTEIAQYLIACIEELPNIHAHIFRYPINSEAPFQIAKAENITYYERNEYNYEQLQQKVDEIAPEVIVCSGWIEKDYLKVCKSYKESGKATTVLMFDNYWENTLKQHIATLVAPFYLKKRFSKVWVPGEIHRDYAKRLGFDLKDVSTGFYVSDTDKFNQQFSEVHDSKKADFPKRILYVGRYLTLKGIEDLWQAFIQFKKTEAGKDWELWCVGTGELYDARVEHEGIKHFGFMQPQELVKLIEGAGVFVMPSHYDHWGVAVQEFAASGFPLICSEKVGAASSFLEEGVNGFSHQIKNPDSLAEAMRKMSEQSDEQLWEMGKISHQKAQSITKKGWVATLQSYLPAK